MKNRKIVDFELVKKAIVITIDGKTEMIKSDTSAEVIGQIVRNYFFGKKELAKKDDEIIQKLLREGFVISAQELGKTTLNKGDSNITITLDVGEYENDEGACE
jgi:hypothetical protein